MSASISSSVGMEASIAEVFGDCMLLAVDEFSAEDVRFCVLSADVICSFPEVTAEIRLLKRFFAYPVVSEAYAEYNSFTSSALLQSQVSWDASSIFSMNWAASVSEMPFSREEPSSESSDVFELCRALIQLPKMLLKEVEESSLPYRFAAEYGS